MPRHPIHPALAHFPIGAWSIATGLDIVSLFSTELYILWKASTWLIGLGLILALGTMAAGAWDLSRIVKNQNALVGLAIRHVMVMAVVWCLYLVTLIARLPDAEVISVSQPVVALSVLSFVALMVGGWLGGDLVYGHGANVRQPVDTSSIE